MKLTIFGREPAVVLGVISATLSLVVTLGIGMTSVQAGWWVAGISAAFAAITAWRTRPIAPSAFTGLVTVVAALLGAYHFNVAPETVGAINGIVLAGLVLLGRGQISPVQSDASGKNVSAVSDL
jgi:zinc transporter ZupT